MNSFSNSSNVVNGGWGGGNWVGGNAGWGGGNWGGGGYRGWGGGNWGGGYGGWGGGFGPGYYGGGWASPYYGNWYRGNWGNSGSFWTGFGLGALSSFGVSSLYGGYGYSGLYSYFPTWGMSTYGSWGLGSLATTSLYSSYVNPYNTIVVQGQPAQTTVVYDYSQPINVAATPPEASIAESTEQVFSAARDSFKAGDYGRALELADQVLKQTPNAPVVHEFRALCLFALQRYDEAASVSYAVLSTGPGWNWSTLIGLYPNVEIYTAQLRALESAARSNPTSPSLQFLLGYEYLVQGHDEAAVAQFDKVTKLQPDDQLSASFVKAFRDASTAQQTAAAQPVNAALPANSPAALPVDAPATQPVTTPTAQPPADANLAQTQPGQADQNQPPPPTELQGIWKAQPAPDVTISLTLKPEGVFQWVVDNKGQKQTLEGQAGFQNGTLALLQNQGPPLVGKVTQSDPNKFVFAPPGTGNKAPGLTFTR